MPNHKTSKNVYLGKDPFRSSVDYVDAKKLAIYIQGVTGGMCQTSGECSLC